MKLTPMLTAKWISLLLFLPSVAAFGAQYPPYEPDIRFLDRETGAREIVSNRYDSYFSSLTREQMSAKTGSPITGSTLAEARQETLRRYQAAVEDFTNEEKFILRLFVEEQYPALAEDYPDFGRMPWSFIKVADNIEGGMVFTRGAHIVIPRNKLRLMLDATRGPFGENDVNMMDSLLIHEQFHVFQRLNPGLFQSLYSGLWGLIPSGTIDGWEFVRDQLMPNPDESELRWIIPIRRDGGNLYLLPVGLARRDADGRLTPYFSFQAILVEPMMEGFQILESEAGGPIPATLTEGEDAGVQLYQDLLPLVGGIVHPHEISAPLFTRIFLTDAFGEGLDSERGRRSRIILRHRDWFRRNLGSPSYRTAGQ